MLATRSGFVSSLKGTSGALDSRASIRPNRPSSATPIAIGPIARSYVGTALQSRLRATGLALLAASWVVAEAVGADKAVERRDNLLRCEGDPADRDSGGHGSAKLAVTVRFRKLMKFNHRVDARGNPHPLTFLKRHSDILRAARNVPEAQEALIEFNSPSIAIMVA